MLSCQTASSSSCCRSKALSAYTAHTKRSEQPYSNSACILHRICHTVYNGATVTSSPLTSVLLLTAAAQVVAVQARMLPVLDQ
eukprot:20215-Heterococcus_DN1.PRE.4